MTKPQEELFNRNMKLVHYVAQKRFGFVDSDPSYDDYAQEGFIGLMRACETFDESKGYQFATYAIICIRNQIAMYLRKTCRATSYYRKIYNKWCEARDRGMTIEQFCKSTRIPQYTIAQAKALMSPVELDMQISSISDSDGADTFSDIIADPSTIDGLHISEEELGISMPEIKSYIMKVADMYEHKHWRDIWIDYTYALIFCAETGGNFTEVQESKHKYLSEKYKCSQPHISRILKRGTIWLKDIIAKNEGM